MTADSYSPGPARALPATAKGTTRTVRRWGKRLTVQLATEIGGALTPTVATRLACDERSVRDLIYRGRLISVRIGRQHIVSLASLARYQAARSRRGPTKQAHSGA